MKQAKIKSCELQYDKTYEVILDNGYKFYSSREYQVDTVINYSMFMGTVRVH